MHTFEGSDHRIAGMTDAVFDLRQQSFISPLFPFTLEFYCQSRNCVFCHKKLPFLSDCLGHSDILQEEELFLLIETSNE